MPPAAASSPHGSLLDGIDHAPAAARAQGDSASSRGYGDYAKIVIACAALLAAGFLVYVQVFAGEDVQALTRKRVMIDSEDHALFTDYTINIGDVRPFTNPKTGKHTLYPAEHCYWTREGGARYPGTPILLNEYLGRTEPTICPDCGRRVVFNNPTPKMEDMQKARTKALGTP
ncbi:hypothetical protein BH11PLA1_BH11PLA1_21260 [soil metagenome]